MKNPAQLETHLSGIRVSGGAVLLSVAAGLWVLGLVGARMMLRS
jgi:hypothetical protein